MISNLPTTKTAPKGGLSQIKEKSPFEIIEEDIEKFDLKMDPKKAYAALMQMTQKSNYRILRANDSILLIDNHGNGTGEGIMFTADKPQTFVTTLRQFNKALIKSGIKQMSFIASGIAIEPLLKKAKINYEAEPTTMTVGKEKRKALRITVYE